jgi:hypothetical protein
MPNNPQGEYRSLMVGVLQYLLRQHGSFDAIPSNYKKYFVRSERWGTLTITVKEPEDISSALLEARQFAQGFVKSDFQATKPATDVLESAQPQPKTMDDFWIAQGWYRETPQGGRRLSMGQWKDDPEVQKAAVRFLALEVLLKDPRDLTKGDFHGNRLSGLLSDYYNNSPFAAVSEAFPEQEIKAWEMPITPNDFYTIPSNRTDATCWLVKKLGKDPRDLTGGDFHGNRFNGLLSHYHSSPYEAALEAGLVTESDEAYMRNRNR